jgi:hypothetical protein
MAAPADALVALASELRADGSVVPGEVRDPGGVRPELGMLAAAGPRAAAQRGEYALLVEAVREGYLLHYGEPRLVAAADDDLALLVGDYLYALGLERLAALGDLDAVRELSDLISLSAQLHAEQRDGGLPRALWLASAIALGCGSSDRHEEAKSALRRGEGVAGDLLDAARATADSAGLAPALEGAAEAIDFAGPRRG